MKEFFKRYKFLILFIIGFLVLITILLIVFSAGPQQGAFIYQIH